VRPPFLSAAPARRDRYHDWAKIQLQQIEPPLLTSESVLSEACFLLARAGQSAQTVLELIHRQVVRVALCLEDEIDPIGRLMKRYADVPISLADAALVRLSEIYAGSRVFTLDSDFRRYRKNGRQVIPLIIPDDRT
jgi:predicted nucleic acid-binding protein